MSMLNNSPLVSQLRNRWAGLVLREKRMLMALVVFLVIASFYSLIWQPIQTGQTQQQAALSKAQANWQWLNEQAPKVMAQPKQSSAFSVNSKTELMDVLQKSLSQQNLLQSAEGLNLNRKGVTVSFTEVNAPRLFRWLSKLEQKGLNASKMDLTPIKAGFTEAEIEFEVSQ